MDDDVPVGKGSVIDSKYLVLDHLGSGGFGEVFRCCLKRDGPAGPIFAVKLLRSQSGVGDEQLRRFRREADILWSTQHPNIVRCVDYGRWNSRHYVVMEFADGGSLEDLLGNRKTLSVPETAWIAYQVAAGLQAARLPHRDIKPANLLFANPPGKSLQLVPGNVTTASRTMVADWGLAMTHTPQHDLRITKTGHIMGSPHFMSPEQCRDSKNVSPRSDIYAIGIVMFYCVTGAPPFEGEDATAVLIQQVSDPVPWPSDMQPALRSVLERCLAKADTDRYPDMLSLRQALQPLLGVASDWRYLNMATEPSPTPQGGLVQWIRRVIPGARN